MSAHLCGRLQRLHLLHAPLHRTLAATTFPDARLSQPSSSSSVVDDFLTTSCGLNPSQAFSAARSLRFDLKSRQQPESVLALLRSYGFSDAQVAEIVARWPRVLLCKAQLTLAPKLQYLARAGFPTALIAQEPGILKRSLDGHIRPCFEFLRCFLGGADDVGRMLRRQKWCFSFDMKSTMIPNVGLLVELGVAMPAISRLMVSHPRALMMNHERFVENVQNVQDWGLQPGKNLFLHAVRVVNGMSKSTLAARLELLKSLGWSEEEVISAFRSCPLCLLVSDQKIKTMNSFARRLGLGPSDLSKRPKLLMYSFHKRILPRYAVWRVLASKGLIEPTTQKLISMFFASEEQFLDIHVKRCMGEVPDLMDVYLGKIKVEEGFYLNGEERKNKLKL